MKKKITFLFTTALLAVGMAFYVNNSSNVISLNDSNIEALTGNGDPGNGGSLGGGNGSQSVNFDPESHIMILTGYDNVKDDKGKDKNDCYEVTGQTCRLSTATALTNAQGIANIIATILGALNPLAAIISALAGLL